MKKLIFLFVFGMLAAVAAQAQDYYYETQSDAASAHQRSAAERQKRIDNHIGGVKVYSYKPGSTDAGTIQSESVFDARGNVTSYKLYKKNGKLKYTKTSQWNDKDKKTEDLEFKGNGKLVYKFTMTYNSAGSMTDHRQFFGNDTKLWWHSIAKYDEKENILELKYLMKDDKKETSKYVYTYYPDGSRKQTIQYKKGKVKHTWNYDCNPAGALAEKSYKDSSKVCIRYETDKDGNKIKIREENVKQGKIVRYVYRYDKNDNTLDVSGFDADGKTRYQYTAKYDDKNNRTEYAVYKGKSNKLKERGIIHYDSSGNISDVAMYKSAQDAGKTFKYTYLKGL